MVDAMVVGVGQERADCLPLRRPADAHDLFGREGDAGLGERGGEGRRHLSAIFNRRARHVEDDEMGEGCHSQQSTVGS